MDREDRADRDVRVDVRRAVQRVEQQDVVPRGELLGDRDQVLGLLGGHHAQMPPVVHRVHHHVVGVDVELADFLAVDVLGARHAEDVDEARLADFAMDQLRGERDVVQDAGQLAGRAGVLPLLLEDEPAQGHDVSLHGAPPLLALRRLPVGRRTGRARPL